MKRGFKQNRLKPFLVAAPPPRLERGSIYFA